MSGSATPRAAVEDDLERGALAGHCVRIEPPVPLAAPTATSNCNRAKTIAVGSPTADKFSMADEVGT